MYKLDETKELTVEEKLIEAKVAEAWSRGRAEGMREMYFMVTGKKEPAQDCAKGFCR